MQYWYDSMGFSQGFYGLMPLEGFLYLMDPQPGIRGGQWTASGHPAGARGVAKYSYIMNIIYTFYTVWIMMKNLYIKSVSVLYIYFWNVLVSLPFSCNFCNILGWTCCLSGPWVLVPKALEEALRQTDKEISELELKEQKLGATGWFHQQKKGGCW